MHGDLCGNDDGCDYGRDSPGQPIVECPGRWRWEQRIGVQSQRSHCREVQAADRDNEKCGPVELTLQCRFSEQNPQSRGADCNRPHYRRGDEGKVPADVSRHLKGLHARKMHRADRCADDGTTDRRVDPKRNANTDGRNRRRNDKRQYGPEDSEADRKPRRIRQLGNEMRCPDAAAEYTRCGRKPWPCAIRRGLARALDQATRCKAGE